MTQPSTQSVLEALTKSRLVALGRELGVAVPPQATKATQIETLLQSPALRFRELLRSFQRDELKAALRAHGLDDSGRARPALQARLLEARGEPDSAPPPPAFRTEDGAPRYAPRQGDIVRARQRQWLVEDVVPPAQPPAGPRGPISATLVRLVCLDDDAQGRRAEVLWELELGARVMQPEAHGLGAVPHIDPPRHFAAYYHALKWNAVTATDARLFQAPFRAGIQLLSHQLTPLKKALELPRANLFIADDVGLGKTIEAGLVLQELLLRQQVDFCLIVAPASVCLQWREEMEKRFGLHFEIYNRAFVLQRQKERGFGVNPWTTHQRFIISYPTLRRPEYRDPLLQRLGERAHKSLLILDEAHTAAPATASKYAIDSRITRVVRDVAPRFENRLFLSATPHNGHSNSFSALLEILDRQRFTRGVRVKSADELEPVMVRRLKSDLRGIDSAGRFPERKTVQVDLTHDGAQWHARYPGTDPAPIGEADIPAELTLSTKLAEYTALMKPAKGRGQLVFTNLQKRLLSSIDAFARTLDLHARAVGEGRADTELALAPALSADEGTEAEEDEYGPDDEALEAEEAARAAASSRAVQTPEGRARQLLGELQDLAARHRHAPDAKVLALVDWIRRHQCPGARIGGLPDDASKADRAWTDRRVLVFTEYGDTKRYLARMLRAAIAGSDDDDLRVLEIHGGMSDDQREEIQRAFNSPPGDHPVRILIATDAAREGVNLQGHCADLFHFDVPWNPARMEQRNGRIDRTMQPADEVRCGYFVYPERAEDRVLTTLVRKVDTIQRELGSLGSVVMDKLEDVLRGGIDDTTAERMDEAEQLGGRREVAQTELESQRDETARLAREIDEAGEILNASREVTDFDPDRLRDAVDVGLELAGAGRLERIEPVDESDGPPAYRVPGLPESWQRTLDFLRPPRPRDEPLWEWRKRDPQPVVFEPPPRMNSALVHLHLSHPFVQRLLARFRAQGFSAHDLSRVTIVRNRHDAVARALAFGRLSLFGPGAVRLHDQVIAAAAPWYESKSEGHLVPFRDKADKKALDMLERIFAESPTLDGLSDQVRERLRQSAPEDFKALWKRIAEDADDAALRARQALDTRGHEEAEALARLLDRQRAAIQSELSARRQTALEFTDAERAERDQYEQDQKHMAARLERIDHELETEPAAIRTLYQVELQRLEPLGLVYLWPGRSVSVISAGRSM